MLKNIYVRNLIIDTIVLIGPSGAGKTSLGRLIADELHWDFYDTDEQTALHTGMLCNDFIRQIGLRSFRAIEKKILFSLLLPKTVIASGAGIIEESYIELLKKETLLWLIIEPLEVIEKRMTEKDKSERPLWEERAMLYNRRLSLYTKYADIVTSSDIQEIVKETNRIKSTID